MYVAIVIGLNDPSVPVLGCKPKPHETNKQIQRISKYLSTVTMVLWIRDKDSVLYLCCYRFESSLCHGDCSVE